ncbi:MAG: urease accessory protein UreH [Nitrososphaera sp.]
MIVDQINQVVEAFTSLGGGVDAITPAGVLLLGLIMGLRHAMEADHVAAVSTLIASGERKLSRAPVIGVLWGLGHTATLLAAGLAVLLLAINIPERITAMMEFGVGIMLVLLGLTVLTGFNTGRFLRGIFRRNEKHAHMHIHKETGLVHSHEHDHQDHMHGHKSLIVGMVHGFAGSGTLMLAVVATIDSVPLALAYIAIFGAGSIASMAGMSALIGFPIAKARSLKFNLALKYAAAVVAFVIGAGLMYELGVVERLFF